MPPPPHDTASAVHERDVALTTTDGVTLAARWHVCAGDSAAPPRTTTVVVPGAGIPANRYARLARHLAHEGAAVLTFDYRGIGRSRGGALKGLATGMDDWARYDIGAALVAAKREYPALPQTAVAHSVGTLLIGAAPGAADLSRLVFLGAHTGYWRDYHVRWRIPLYLTWHALMPAVTRAVGYFPGRRLRLGEDLPRQVALDWAGRRSPGLVRTPEDRRRFGPHVERFGDVRVPTLSLSISDDAFAPPSAAERLIAMYPALPVTRETFSPAQAGAKRLGHFGFLREPAGKALWPRIAAWLMPPT